MLNLPKKLMKITPSLVEPACRKVANQKGAGKRCWSVLVAVLLAWLALGNPVAQAQTVTTLAGTTGTSGSINATGTAASFYTPMGAAVDGSGNVYVADTYNNTIRKITPAGVVTTFAGTAGVQGSLDGTGAAATFNNPTGIAVDSSGNVYVADSGNQTIRKITPAGVVTTIPFYFSYPTGVAVDGSGNVFVADSGNNTICKIDSAGPVTTFAGTAGLQGNSDGTGTAARFNNPAGVAVDATSGTVYVADQGNQTIRKITSAGVVTTLAGSAGISGAIDATGAAARFNNPAGVAVDASGTVYIADSGNQIIRTITSAGVVTTLAGSTQARGSVDDTGSAARFNNPTGLTVDSDGTVYVADSGNYIVRKIPVSLMLTPANGANLSSSTVTFTWNAGVNAAQYQLKVGTTLGGSDLYLGTAGSQLTDTATGLHGSTIYVQLEAKVNGVWNISRYLYTLANTTKAVMATPTSGSTLTNASTTFTWSAGSGSPEYKLFIGSTPGAFDLYAGLAGTGLSQPVTLPTDGRTIYVQLLTLVGGQWKANNYSYTALDTRGVMTSPVDRSTLTSASAVFTWTGDSSIIGYKLAIGSTLGASDIYSKNEGTSTTDTVALPTDGSPIYVQLGSTTDGTTWNYTYYTYTALNTGAGITSPVGGSTLTGASTTFTWSAGTGVSQYKLAIGSTAGGSDLYAGNEGTRLTKTVTLPTDGRTIYVQLSFTKDGSNWTSSNYTYTAFDPRAGITSPVAGSALTAASTTFNWNAGTGATQYKLNIGSTAGASDLYAGTATTNLTQAVTLPTDGRTIYVTLYSKINGTWQSNSYTYTAFDTRALITFPVGGSTLVGASTTFTWSGGGGLIHYKLQIGSTVGASDLYNGDEGANLSKTITTLPVDGSTIYVQLGSTNDGTTWNYAQYTYTTATIAPVRAQITSPVAGSALAAASTTFNWNTGTGVSQYKLNIGSTVGGSDLYAGAATTNLTQAVTLPTDGRTIYVQLLSLISGQWQSNSYTYTANIGPTGSLKVTLTSAPAGAQWQVDGGAWQNSGVIVSGLSAANIHTVSFKTAGGTTPTNRMVTVGVAGTTSVTESYVDSALTETVATFAGSPHVTGTDNGSGSAARFSAPYGVGVDRSGNLYVADSANSALRKITPAGDVTTVAITGPAPITPTGVAVDGNGNIYVADLASGNILKITPAGVAYTLARGLATPIGVAVDAFGNVYVANSGDYTISKITPAGVKSTLAGTVGVQGSIDGTGAAAQFMNLSGIAVDSGGNVYVTDNTTVRMITPAGVVSTLAGTATVQGSFDGTGTAAQFMNPSGIALDSGGNLYVADNTTVRMITPAGVVTTYAGDAGGAMGNADGTGSDALFYLNPATATLNGVAVDRNGNVYVADTGNSTLRKITPTAISGLTGSLQVTLASAPAGAQWQIDGGIWDGGTWYNSGATVPSLSVGLHTISFKSPSGVAPGDRTVTVLNGKTVSATASYVGTMAQTVMTVTGSAGVFGSSDGALNAALYATPNGITRDGVGNIYVADTANHTIRKITPAGVVSTFVGDATAIPGNIPAPAPDGIDGRGSAARFHTPTGVAVDKSGNVYVADSKYCAIRKITPAGIVTTLAGSLTYTPLRDANGHIVSFNVAGKQGSTDAKGSAALFNNPTALAVDRNGYVYVADTGNNTIRKITPDGTVTTLAGNALVNAGSADGTGSAALFNAPVGVTVDASGNVYVADGGNFTIRKITPNGTVTTLAGNAGVQGSFDGTGTAAEFYQPSGVAVDKYNNVYVTDYSTVRKITSAGVVATLAGDPSGAVGSTDGAGNAARFYCPNGVIVDADGSHIYLADANNNTLREITPGTVGQTGSLQVTIAPAVAGAQWQVDGGAWQASAATVTGLSVGIHTVSFNTVGGTTPSNRTVTVLNGIPTSATATYTPATAQTVTTFAGNAGSPRQFQRLGQFGAV